jgi:cold shock CspA family protein
MERKLGVIRSWHGARGFGIIRVGPESSLEKYFLHVSNIRTGTATPEIGMAVEFEVSDKPAKEGQLAQAIRADIHLNQVAAPTVAPVDPSPVNDGKEGAL